MNIVFREEKERLEAELSRNSNGTLFAEIANAIVEKFHISFTTQLDGFDQSYWDFTIDGHTLTLHLEHYLGILLISTFDTSDIDGANAAVRKVANYLSSMNLN
jgi:hypothetical protein